MKTPAPRTKKPHGAETMEGGLCPRRYRDLAFSLPKDASRFMDGVYHSSHETEHPSLSAKSKLGTSSELFRPRDLPA